MLDEKFINKLECLRESVKLLEEENYNLRTAIEKAKLRLEDGLVFCKNDSQCAYDKCEMVIKREQSILDILKGVENE